MDDDQFCSICTAPVMPRLRYPAYVCAMCAAQAAAPDGHPLCFFNLGPLGGFGAEYADSGEPYTSSICNIAGVKCIAAEARFGGIIIQVASG